MPVQVTAATVTLTDPVTGALHTTALLGLGVLPSKLTLWLALDRRSAPDVSVTPSPPTAPAPSLPATQLDDTHAVLAAPLLPTRVDKLASVLQHDVKTTVTLTEPVTAAFVADTLLGATGTSL